jgi:DNA-directed RNA polymerase specialized sigma subunit
METMLTQEMRDSIRSKVKRYTREACHFALQDIRETETTLGRNHPDRDYIAKLEYERDEIGARLRTLQGQKTCPCCHGKGSIPENEVLP